MSKTQIVDAANALVLVLFTSWALFEYRSVSSPLLWTYSLLTFLLGAYMAVQFFSQPTLLMEDTPMFVEEGREMVGAWLVSGWMAFLAAKRKAHGVLSTSSPSP